MAEKKTTTKKAATKATAEKKVAAPKAAAEKKVATKAAPKAAAKATAKVSSVSITPENVGFKAGDVYQALAKAEKALTVAQIAKEAGIASEEVYLGIGWLFKEGKIKAEDNAIALA